MPGVIQEVWLCVFINLHWGKWWWNILR